MGGYRMQRRTYLLTTAGVLTGGLAGCTGTPQSDSDGTTSDGSTTNTSPTPEAQQTGLLATAVSDDPQTAIDDFEKLVVPITEIWVHPKGDQQDESTVDETASNTTTTVAMTDTEADSATSSDDSSQQDTANETPEDSGPHPTTVTDEDSDESKDGDGTVIRIQLDEPAHADLVKLQGDAQAVINEEELPVGTYEQIKLWVGDDVEAVLKDGGNADVTTPGNAPLKFNKEFEIRGGTKTTFTADFAPHARGKNAKNGYILRPVATEVRVNYTDLQSESTPEQGSGNQTATQTNADTNSSNSSV